MSQRRYARTEPNYQDEEQKPKSEGSKDLESPSNRGSKRILTPEEVFGLTHNEQIFDRVLNARFHQIIPHNEILVHELEVSVNNWGEFLFVSTSRMLNKERYRLTFWGLGFHELRERWITEEWFWYRSNSSVSLDEVVLPEEEVLSQIDQRLANIPTQSQMQPQSRRGELFEMLADLMDEDGARAELDDMDDLLSDLD